MLIKLHLGGLVAFSNSYNDVNEYVTCIQFDDINTLNTKGVFIDMIFRAHDVSCCVFKT